MRWLNAGLAGGALLAAVAAAAAAAATGEDVYKSKCSICHDGCAGKVPCFGRGDEWTARFARGVAGAKTVDNKLISAALFDWD